MKKDANSFFLQLDHLPEGHEALRGRALRCVLVSELMNREEMTVADMVSLLDRLGFALDGRISKAVSDALRWEIGRGRVARIGRGRYRYLGAPPTTAWRIRRLAAQQRPEVRPRPDGNGARGTPRSRVG